MKTKFNVKPVLSGFLGMVLFMLVSSGTGLSRDYILDFVEEHYNETAVKFEKQPLIYHSIQVMSPAGPKVLILTGEENQYRLWLRQYIARDKKFIVKVDDADNDAFISSRAYEVDVTRIHPFNGSKWRYEMGMETVLQGDRYVLVIDANETRGKLISSVIETSGYQVVMARDSDLGLEAFKNQPEKFKLIIANHKAPGMLSGKFISGILKIDNQIPILVETGYRDSKTMKDYEKKYAGAGSVILKPMVLEDLQKNLKNLIQEKA